MARKSDIEHSNANNSNIETIGLHNQSTLLPCEVYSYQNNSRITISNNLILDNCDASDPLLCGVIEEDQPPSYIDVINSAQSETLNLNEPPPPYTSRETLNVPDQRNNVF